MTLDPILAQQYTLECPAQIASFPAACAAFLRTHEKIVIPPKHSLELPTTLYKARGEMTKYRRLINDLAAVRAAEPDMRVVVFTRAAATIRIRDGT